MSFWYILRFELLDSLKILLRVSRPPLWINMSPETCAIWLLEDVVIPTSACLMDGESLMPSPIKITGLLSCLFFINSSFSSGF